MSCSGYLFNCVVQHGLHVLQDHLSHCHIVVRPEHFESVIEPEDLQTGMFTSNADTYAYQVTLCCVRNKCTGTGMHTL